MKVETTVNVSFEGREEVENLVKALRSIEHTQGYYSWAQRIIEKIQLEAGGIR